MQFTLQIRLFDMPCQVGVTYSLQTCLALTQTWPLKQCLSCFVTFFYYKYDIYKSGRTSMYSETLNTHVFAMVFTS